MLNRFYISLVLPFWLLLPTTACAHIAWEQIPLPDSVEIISFEVGDNGALFVGAYHFQKGGVYRSNNNGTTWEEIGPYEKNAYDLEFTNDNQLFTASASRIYKHLYEDVWEEKIHMPTWVLKN